MTFAIPWESLLGGMLLGISATVLLLLNGKIAGISGILNGLLVPESRDFAWRLLFAAGMIGGGLIGVVILGYDVPATFAVDPLWLAVAGLLVGVGTRLANGCTSGHGICGIGRLSRRSMVATGVFMVVAAATVFVRLHLM